MGKLSKDRRDIYYRKAKEDGYRARSAYKLLQLDDEFQIFDQIVQTKDGCRVVDLCAAPGSWSQVVKQRLQYKALDLQKNPSDNVIVAVDLQEMAPIEGVIQIKGDITSEAIVSQILSCFKGKKAQLILCDGAPDVTGMHDIDEYIQSQILFAAFRLAIVLLEPGATFVAKMFRGENASFTFSQFYTFFGEVYCGKPSSSRVSSFEAFVVCKNFQCPISHTLLRSQLEESSVKDKDKLGQHPQEVCSSLEKYFCDTTLPFIACGDLQGFDSDTTFFLSEEHQFRNPIQAPINPPYSEALKYKKST